MKIAVFSVGLLFVGFATHWLLWRVRIPKRQTMTLLAVFMGVLFAAITVAWLVPQTGTWAPASIWEVAQVAILYVGISLGYIVAYSTLEAQSPALGLVKFVADAGAQGRSRADLCAHLEGAEPLQTRLQAMLRDGLLREENHIYRLTAKGRSWGQVFLVWRRFLHIGVGG
jgi:hypothetical protein